MQRCSYPTISRRRLLAGAGVFAAWAAMPKVGFAGTRDPRLVVVILRGALDGLAAVAISVTTLDSALARILEPRAAHPARRLKAVAALVGAGVPTYVNIAPVIPAITDHEIEAIAAEAAAAGAKGISAIPLRLPHELAPLFRDWLEVHYPDRAGKVMRIVQELRGGKDNDPAFFNRMRGRGPWADLLRTRVDIARRRYGFVKGKFDLRCDLFERPELGGQMRLL